MKRFFKILVLAIAGTLVTTEIFGQVQITTRREKLKDFTSKITKVVLTGDDFMDEALKESVAAHVRSPRTNSAPMRSFKASRATTTSISS